MTDHDNDNSKTLNNTDISGAKENVPDLITFGDGDTFKLICKASSESEGWMKSTKAMEIEGVGCLIQVTTQQRNNVAEALTFVPNTRIVSIKGDEKNGRKIVKGASKKVSDQKKDDLLAAVIGHILKG